MILFYDTETTGFPTKEDFGHESQPHLIQFGWQLRTEENIVSEGNMLICPLNEDWEMSPGAERTHGISKAKVEEFGVKANIAAALIYNLAVLSGLRVCHNTAFDQKIITTLLRRNGIGANPFWEGTACTMKEGTDLCELPGRWEGTYKWPKLQELHTHLFGEGFEGAHDALEDVRATSRCFYAMRKLGVI